MRVYLTILLALLNTCKLLAFDFLPTQNGELVKHAHYALSYLEEHEQAEWVYYELDANIIAPNVKRTNNFRQDPSVTTGSATIIDYKNSGYDRGHLAPAASMTGNKTAMSESFYMSNMSPQHPSLNRGKWQELESLVRSWVLTETFANIANSANYTNVTNYTNHANYANYATHTNSANDANSANHANGSNDTNTKLYVITGTILKSPLGIIGKNKVTVPSHFYKIIYSPSKNTMIAFLIPNQKPDAPLEAYITTVDAIENLSNIDFFPQLEDDLEELLESNSEKTKWQF